MGMNENRLQNCRAEYRNLIRRLDSLDFIWPGTIQQRKLTCGQPSCSCHTNSQALHGPYFYWTTKVNSKTVSKMLTQDEVALLQPWINNRKQLERTLKSMNTLSKRAAAILLKNKRLIQKLSGA